MQYRQFGATDLTVSALGFGAAALGGNRYGAVDKAQALRALAMAEELGCNFVDTAGTAAYGDSELLLGEFLAARRQRWVVATKYSGQAAGIQATVDEQLRRLRTDHIDFYQLHWTPGHRDRQFYEQLYRLKQGGKVRYIGVSLYNCNDLDYVADCTAIDGFQVCCSLLDPLPLLARLDKVRARRLGVVVRSSLHNGFLTGKYRSDSVFTDASDQRSEWSRQEIADVVAAVEKFQFLSHADRSLAWAALRYPLAFAEVSTVIIGTKTAEQAQLNFAVGAYSPLSADDLTAIRLVQQHLGLFAELDEPVFLKWLKKIKRRFF